MNIFSGKRLAAFGLVTALVSGVFLSQAKADPGCNHNRNQFGGPQTNRYGTPWESRYGGYNQPRYRDYGDRGFDDRGFNDRGYDRFGRGGYNRFDYGDHDRYHDRFRDSGFERPDYGYNAGYRGLDPRFGGGNAPYDASQFRSPFGNPQVPNIPPGLPPGDFGFGGYGRGINFSTPGGFGVRLNF